MSVFHGFDLDALIATLGYVGVTFIVFAETGLFIGFFLPGDSLLFSTGLLASHGYFKIEILTPLLIVFSILGYILGYWFGGHLGRWLLTRPDTWYFKKEHYERSQVFFQKHGGKALLFARFLPVVRTFIPIVAGVAKMNKQRYMGYNVAGGVLWAGGLTLAGYFLGQRFPQAKEYILPIMVGVIFLSLVPVVIQYFRSKSQR